MHVEIRVERMKLLFSKIRVYHYLVSIDNIQETNLLLFEMHYATILNILPKQILLFLYCSTVLYHDIFDILPVNKI